LLSAPVRKSPRNFKGSGVACGTAFLSEKNGSTSAKDGLGSFCVFQYANLLSENVKAPGWPHSRALCVFQYANLLPENVKAPGWPHSRALCVFQYANLLPENVKYTAQPVLPTTNSKFAHSDPQHPKKRRPNPKATPPRAPVESFVRLFHREPEMNALLEAKPVEGGAPRTRCHPRARPNS